MPWSELTPMDQRLQFVVDSQRGTLSLAEWCARYGVSRKTGYKWLALYRREGPKGLADHSRRPHQSPTATPAAVRTAIVTCRQAHPTWGPKKLLTVLARQAPEVEWPAVSTAARLLKQAELVVPRRRHPQRAARPRARAVVSGPNDVWATDYKGEFRMGDGRYCYPLTVMDCYSRYLLACEGMLRISSHEAQQHFERLFRVFGLPTAIRSDNGIPFASPALGGLSRLSVWWLQLGIQLDRNRPSHPEENAALERLHRTLKAETACPPAGGLPTQQRWFDAFGYGYNYERPHEGLGLEVPATYYAPSLRPYPARLPAPQYAGAWEVRRVASNGDVRWGGRRLFLSEVLEGHDVGFEPIDDGVWAVYFYAAVIGRFNERAHVVTSAPERG